MRIWFDTEFLEDGSTIELISIGMVREDGEEYYAEPKMSYETILRILDHPWLEENVIPHLTGDVRSRQQVAKEIEEFTKTTGNDEPEFWAYCGAYDWVVLNQLYGSMVDHPKRWPFYCNDIAQLGLHLGISRREFPKQETVAHNALSDARWTRDTWLWLQEQNVVGDQ